MTQAFPKSPTRRALSMLIYWSYKLFDRVVSLLVLLNKRLFGACCHTITAPFVFHLSAFPHVVGKPLCLFVFRPFAHEAWVYVSTISRFGWGSPCAMISRYFGKNEMLPTNARDLCEPSASHLDGCQPLLRGGEVILWAYFCLAKRPSKNSNSGKRNLLMR